MIRFQLQYSLAANCWFSLLWYISRNYGLHLHSAPVVNTQNSGVHINLYLRKKASVRKSYKKQNSNISLPVYFLFAFAFNQVQPYIIVCLISDHPISSLFKTYRSYSPKIFITTLLKISFSPVVNNEKNIHSLVFLRFTRVLFIITVFFFLRDSTFGLRTSLLWSVFFRSESSEFRLR